jgi:hypothetical protein
VRTPKFATRVVNVVAVPLVLAGVVAGIAPAGSAAARTGTADLARSLPASASLYGVAATSASNAWAVGQANSGKTLILHWNGTAWKSVPSPSPAGGGELNGVAATSARSAWAVGYTESGKTLILRWNGAAWKRVPSPTPARGGALFGVAATSARSAWAVGCAGDCFRDLSRISTLILHWNGTAWKRVPSPSYGPGSSLNAVAATSAGSAWAVGCTSFCEISAASPQTMILRWNGTAWKRVPSPAAGKVGALTGIAASSARIAWAVGCAGFCFGPGATPTTMILAWDGTAWKRVPSPSPGGLRPGGGSVLAGVAVTSARNAWAVGYDRANGKTLIERWNGNAWKQVRSPGGQLYGVAAPSSRDAWAVGVTASFNALILRWNGTAWK